MSRLRDGWRYYGCAKWGCDAVNPDYASYGALGRSWCLHHRPGRLMRLALAVFRPSRDESETGKAMLPIEAVHRHYVLVRRQQQRAGRP